MSALDSQGLHNGLDAGSVAVCKLKGMATTSELIGRMETRNSDRCLLVARAWLL